MAMIGKIRRMFFRDKLSLNEIARRTSLARNTIKKWLRAPKGAEPKYRRSSRPCKLTAFEAELIQALEADAHRPKRDRRTARALTAQIRQHGYAGGYTRVSDFIREWRENSGRALASRAFVPLKFELGDRTRCVHIGDRESDIYELFCAAQDAGTHFLLRTCVDRLVGDGTHTIAEEMPND